ncbi:hypothetical protein [Rurimicrobium arvi]|uniref:DUF1573 domain-containing protein n=1 Tax=Rurimicrobium arvi TaxID=2049916 RepID=A0ABP8N130_9BACT
MPANIINHYIRQSALFIGGVQLLSACSGDNVQQPSATAAVATYASASLQVDTIPLQLLPDVHQGCACYFAADSSALRRREFLLVNYFDNRCFMKINGKLIEFRHTLRHIEKNGITLRAVSDQYELRAEFEASDANNNEEWFYRVTLSISDKKEHSVVLHLTGPCNCSPETIG